MSDVAAIPISVSNAHLPLRRFEARALMGQVNGFADQAASLNQAAETFEQGYAKGFVAGCEQAATDFAAERVRLQQLVARSAALQPEPSDELAALIVEAVASLAGKAVGQAPIDKNWLTARAHEAAAIIAECDAARTIWVHPDDAPFLADASLALEVHTDATMLPGSIRIACSSGWIEHGRSLFLEQIDAMRIAR